MAYDQTIQGELSTGQRVQFLADWRNQAGANTSIAAFSDLKVGRNAWLDSVFGELLRIGGLRAGWDSYGSSPIDPNTLKFSAVLANHIWRESLPRPQVIATSARSVVFEWAAPNAELSFEIKAPDVVSYYYCGAETELENQASSVDQLRSLISRLLETNERQSA